MFSRQLHEIIDHQLTIEARRRNSRHVFPGAPTGAVERRRILPVDASSGAWHKLTTTIARFQLTESQEILDQLIEASVCDSQQLLRAEMLLEVIACKLRFQGERKGSLQIQHDGLRTILADNKAPF